MLKEYFLNKRGIGYNVRWKNLKKKKLKFKYD